MRRLLTAHEVAEMIGMHVNYVWAEAKNGNIPSVLLGRNRRFFEDEIIAWLEEQRHAA